MEDYFNLLRITLSRGLVRDFAVKKPIGANANKTLSQMEHLIFLQRWRKLASTFRLRQKQKGKLWHSNYHRYRIPRTLWNRTLTRPRWKSITAAIIRRTWTT